MAHTSRVSIAYGDAGVEQTLTVMAQLIDEGVDSPHVVLFARMMAVRAGVRNQYAQAQAIRAWMARVWRFVDDPPDRDLVTSADWLLAQLQVSPIIAGDCDEAAILGGALGKSVGMFVRLVVLGFPSSEPAEPDRLSHVYAVLLTDDGREVSLDVTRPAGPVPAPTRLLTMDV
jgi:hypothetical protein